MNDPFESLALIEREYSKDEIEQFKKLAKESGIKENIQLSELGDEVISEFMNSIRKGVLENNYFFSSLSETYDNILLWSHYCQSHTGFVLAIEIDENDSHVQKVSYKNNLPAFDIGWYFSFKEEDIDDEDKADSKEIDYLLKDFAIKSEHWSYENEWRVCRAKRGYKRYDMNSVKGIYFGINCDPEIEKIILFLSAGINDDVPVYKMELTKNPIGMIAKDYELPQ
ncbi:DUF2971 domain-containing protein [Flavobacterium sp. ZB4P13]|uniref:DUF2971 domain-containing protein n=1 Tax=Flavobacterium sp. ZB4P13 TaxID=3401728 RepID=UPI003AAEE0A1